MKKIIPIAGAMGVHLFAATEAVLTSLTLDFDERSDDTSPQAPLAHESMDVDSATSSVPTPFASSSLSVNISLQPAAK